MRTPDEQVTEACRLLAEISHRPYLTEADRQAMPLLRGLSDEELDPCGLRPVDVIEAAPAP